MAKSGKLRLVVDTNVWISYFISEQQSPLHSLLLSERFEIIASAELSAEIFEVAARKKFSKLFDQKRLPSLRKFYDQFTTRVKVTSKVSESRDEKDNFLLALSRDSKANYLITGDNDLLVLEQFEETKIVLLADFIKQEAV